MTLTNCIAGNEAEKSVIHQIVALYSTGGYNSFYNDLSTIHQEIISSLLSPEDFYTWRQYKVDYKSIRTTQANQWRNFHSIDLRRIRNFLNNAFNKVEYYGMFAFKKVSMDISFSNPNPNPNPMF
jgi:hypothetical protein